MFQGLVLAYNCNQKSYSYSVRIESIYYYPYLFINIIYYNAYSITDYWLLITDCWFLISDFWFLISDFWFLISDYWLLISDFWLLVTDDYWSLITDYWLLITNYWLLITDCWLPITDCRLLIREKLARRAVDRMNMPNFSPLKIPNFSCVNFARKISNMEVFRSSIKFQRRPWLKNQRNFEIFSQVEKICRFPPFLWGKK